jgi:hypothetical protein
MVMWDATNFKTPNNGKDECPQMLFFTPEMYLAQNLMSNETVYFLDMKKGYIDSC